MASVRHRFESPDTTQTLAEALTEYFAASPMLKRESSLLSPEARQFFRSHDAVHVVYGCGTSMLDEAIVKLASIFGTTGGIRVMRGYVHHETLDIYRKLPVMGTVQALLAAPYIVVRTAGAAWLNPNAGHGISTMHSSMSRCAKSAHSSESKSHMNGALPNPSLHPTFDSRLRRLLPAGELKR
jgi:hypothetical protein